MNSPDGIEITKRFFEALEILKVQKKVRGIQTFTTIYGINRRNLWKIEKENRAGLFDVAWLSYLVKDYGISAEWLLTGVGDVLLTKKEDR